MTAVKRRQVAARPHPSPGHRAAEPRRTGALIGGAAAAALAASALTLTGPGLAAARAVGHFLDFYGGVFCLVALSLAVMGGLLATDRLLLQVRHRILLQGVHRALA